MYGRIINGEEHTFGVSGKLIMNALVMYDHQTRTLWSQFMRKGVRGELAGTELEVIPVTQTTWQTWKELHPDTVVLDKGGRYSRDSYRGYYTSSRAGVLGARYNDDRLDGKALVLGVDIGGITKAYPFSALSDSPVVNDTVGGAHMLVYLDASSGTALAYDRRVNGTPLTFRLEGEPNGILTILVDEQTNSRWMAFTGAAIEGELKGQKLERALSHLSFWFAWKDWNPDTELYQG
ncbi:MAG: DUF3179 domain-containing protein [Chloroflexi bacterium]|nr:DUF3179 domain-containing protein [Chloroflexota bacterium]